MIGSQPVPGRGVMPTVRYLVHDVDAVLPFYEALGFRQVDRWGPPFAILERRGLALWLSGPGTSAARPMPDGAKPVPGGWSRITSPAAPAAAPQESKKWKWSGVPHDACINPSTGVEGPRNARHPLAQTRPWDRKRH